MTELLAAIAREPSAQFMLAAYAIYFVYLLRALTLHFGAKGADGLPEPCALSWFLFSVGTALHIGVEILYGVPLRGLYADMVCGTMSTGIAVLCLVLQRASTRRAAASDQSATEKLSDTGVIRWYALCAMVYLVPELVSRFLFSGLFPEALLFLFGTVSILALTAMNVLEFVPIVQATVAGKTREWSLPWLVWTVSYALMWLVRVEDVPASPGWSHDWMAATYGWMVVLHPAAMLILHVVMAAAAIVGARAIPKAAPARSAARPFRLPGQLPLGGAA